MTSRRKKEREETPVASDEEATTPSIELWGYLHQVEAQRVQAEERQEKNMLAMQQQFADLFKMQMDQQKMQLEQQMQQQKLQMEQQERYWQAQQEKEKEDREKERQRWQYQLDKDKEERKRREKNDIPKLAPMDSSTDVEEYLEVFEGLMKKLQKTEELWSSYLQPVMNNACRTVFTSMPQDKREDYEELKKALLTTCSTEHIRVGAAFWTYERQKGQTFPQMERKLTRLGHRFAKKNTVEETIDAFVMEKLLQSLPTPAATYVRRTEPETAAKAAKAAEEFFKDSGYSPDHPRWSWKPTHRWSKEDRGEPKNDNNQEKQTQEQQKGSKDYETRTRFDKKIDMSKYWDKEKGPQCFECQAWGHLRSKCPSRVMLVTSPKKDRPPPARNKPWTVTAKINGKEVHDLLLDSGAEMTVMSSEVVPRECYTGQVGEARGLVPTVTSFDLAKVPIEIGGWKLDLEVLVAPQGTIKHTALLGRDVPGLEVSVRPPPQEILPVQTRAQRRLAEQMEEQEQKETEESGADPIGVDDLPQMEQNQQGEEADSVDMDDLLQREQDEEADSVYEDEDELPRSDQEQLDDEAHQQDDDDEEEPLPGSQWEDDMFLNQAPPPGEPWMGMTREDLCQKQQRDETLKTLWQESQQDGDSQYCVEDGVLYARDTADTGEDNSLIVVPRELRKKLWDMAHSTPMAGHLGKKKTVRKLTTHFWWPGLSRDVAAWCRECAACQRGNNSKRAKAPLMPLPAVDQPWRRVAIDIVGPLERSHTGNKYILTIMDFSTRYPEAVPLKKTDADTVADALCQTFSRFGLPDELLSDRGSNFLSKVVTALLDMLKIVHLRTSPYHPQSNGMLERFHGTLKAMIRKTCPEPKEWDKWLPYLLFAYREAPHTATGFSPFELLFGRDVRGPLAVVKEQWESKQKLPMSVIDFVQTTQQRLRDMAELAREKDQESKKKSKTWYDRGARDDPLQVNEEVLVLLPEDSPKLSARWHGPYKIVERVSPLSYRIKIPNRRKQVRQFHRNMLKRWVAPADILTVVMAREEEGEVDELPLDLPSTDMGQQPILNTGNRLDDKQRDELKSLLDEFRDVFEDQPGFTQKAEHHIRTGDEAPITQHPYRIPVAWQPAVREEVRQLLESGMIVHSESPWASPVVCVRKKDDTLRMCVDYRKLNAVTDEDVYPMPRVEEQLDLLGEAKFITTLDLAKGYYQVPVAPEDQDKTAFITPEGKFNFTRMPFGLKGAPATFQRLMDTLLATSRDHASSYIDDTVIFSSTWTEHLVHLREVLDIFRDAGLTVKKGKCTFAAGECTFLGHTVGQGKVRPDTAKVRAVKEFQLPRTKRNVRAFLGLAGYYRRFIHNFSSIAAPLSDLTAKTMPDKVEWKPEHQQAFEELKKSLQQEPVLQNPDYSRPFTLHTDASNRGVGAVLSQVQADGTDLPVAFYSRKFLPRETRYTTTEKECLAVINAVRHFEVYLLGRQFDIVTDHSALKYLTTIKHGGARLSRWALALQPFSYTIRHREGASHSNADGLSRQGWPVDSVEGATCGEATKEGEGGVG